MFLFFFIRWFRYSKNIRYIERHMIKKIVFAVWAIMYDFDGLQNDCDGSH